MAATGALRILLTGAAGLVGQGVALACQRSPQVSRLTALVRHPGSLSGAGSELIVPDFLRIQDRSGELAGFDACFYCAGAPPVGTAEAEYRRVTLTPPWRWPVPGRLRIPKGAFCMYPVPARTSEPADAVEDQGRDRGRIAGLPVRTVMLRPGGVRPVPGTGTRHALLKPLYWGGAPLMKLASAIAPSLMTSNLALGQAMIALAGREHPPATVECADINRIAAGLGDPAS